MPIGSINTGFATLPAVANTAGKNERFRDPAIETEEQAGEVQRDNSPTNPDIELQQATDDSLSINQANPPVNSNFNLIPSFGELPTSQSQALQTYLANQQAARTTLPEGGEFIVGIDVFV